MLQKPKKTNGEQMIRTKYEIKEITLNNLYIIKHCTPFLCDYLIRIISIFNMQTKQQVPDYCVYTCLFQCRSDLSLCGNKNMLLADGKWEKPSIMSQRS